MHASRRPGDDDGRQLAEGALGALRQITAEVREGTRAFSRTASLINAAWC